MRLEIRGDRFTGPVKITLTAQTRRERRDLEALFNTLDQHKSCLKSGGATLMLSGPGRGALGMDLVEVRP